jgi:radical SAM protein with 4Fe4S-binding SPASM domain
MCDIPKHHTEELTTSQWREVIKDAHLLGASTVVFSGGEPLLRDDIFDLIFFTKNNGMNVCLVSNGLLINRDVAQRLAQSGIDVVNVSLEGPSQIHDYLRGQGTFQKALLALDNLKRYKIETTIASTVSRYNYKYLSYIIELAKRYGVRTVKFQPISSIFLRDKPEIEDFFISQGEAEELSQIIKEVMLLCNKYGITSNPSLYLERIPLYLSKRPFNDNNVCVTLWTSCPIDSQGNIYLCWILSGKDRLIGNLRERRFLELWDSARHNFLREQIKKGGCPGCLMSCYERNFDHTGSLNRKMIMNVNLLKGKGFTRYIKDSLPRWQKRFRFWCSYRGSLKEVIRRRKGFLRKKRVSRVQTKDKKVLEAKIREIEMVKQKVLEEIKLLK